MREGKQTYLKSLDDSMVVKAVDGVENGADDGGGIILGRFYLCEDTVKGSLPVISSKEGSILC